MKIVFLGTPEYVIPILDRLHKVFKSKKGESPIAAVVTQPPQPTGRQQLLTYSPVDTWAHKKGVPIYFEAKKLVQDEVKVEVGVVASYGSIIAKEVIEYFPKGILNVHPSLLPKWRGASPVQATIVSGEKQTGVTIIKLDELMDHGPIISQFKEEVQDQDTTESLRARLFERSAEVLTTLIPAYLAGKITPREQDHARATYSKLLKKDHGFIPPEYLSATLQGLPLKGGWKIAFIRDFEVELTSEVVERFVRAMQPWPISWSVVSGQRLEKKRIKILKAHLEPTANHQSLTSEAGQAPLITNRKLVLDEVQLEGKNPVSWKQFREAYPEAEFKD